MATCARCLSGFRFGRSRFEARIAGVCERIGAFTGWNPFPVIKKLKGGGRAGAEALPDAPDPELESFLRARGDLVQETLSKLDRVLSPSRFLIDRFVAHGYRPEQFLHSPNGIPVPAVSERQSARERGADDPLRLGFLGSVTPQKGLHVLARAQSRWPRGRVRLSIHGNVRFDPTYWQSVLDMLVTSETRVAGPFAPAELFRVMGELDAIVVPSTWYENAPLVIAEAQAHGLPVLASRLGGMAEMVRDGVDGLLFEPGDADDLARSVGRLIDEPGLYDRLRAGIEVPRSIDQEADDLLELYGTVIEELQS